MQVLKKHLKEGNFSKVYLFYGEEEYLKDYYLKKFKESLVPSSSEMMNLSVIDGKSPVENIIDAVETYPFMAERKMVVVKNSELFKSGRKEDSERMADFLSKIPRTTVLIFIESEVDKRGKLFKQVQKQGGVTEFNYLKENDLIVWVKKEFSANNIAIDRETTIYLLRTIGNQMSVIKSEIDKLISLNNDSVTKSDIDSICTRSLEAQIFDLVKAIGNKNVTTALEIFNNLLMLKESPIGILVMITRQFRLLFQAKYLIEENFSSKQIIDYLKLPSFVVNEIISQSKLFLLEDLKQAIRDCLLTDLSIKTGKMESVLAIETLIIKYCSL